MSSSDTIYGTILDELTNRKGQDVFIITLFKSAWPDIQLETVKEMQMRLGPHIARINEKLRDTNTHVIPGQLKNTYVLTHKAENE